MQTQGMQDTTHDPADIQLGTLCHYTRQDSRGGADEIYVAIVNRVWPNEKVGLYVISNEGYVIVRSVPAASLRVLATPRQLATIGVMQDALSRLMDRMHMLEDQVNHLLDALGGNSKDQPQPTQPTQLDRTQQSQPQPVDITAGRSLTTDSIPAPSKPAIDPAASDFSSNEFVDVIANSDPAAKSLAEAVKPSKQRK